MSAEITLLEMLDARERRVERQRELLGAGNGTLVCFTMNIAGPVKRDAWIEKGFRLGLGQLEAQLRVSGMAVLRREISIEDTPCCW